MARKCIQQLPFMVHSKYVWSKMMKVYRLTNEIEEKAKPLTMKRVKGTAIRTLYIGKIGGSYGVWLTLNPHSTQGHCLDPMPMDGELLKATLELFEEAFEE